MLPMFSYIASLDFSFFFFYCLTIVIQSFPGAIFMVYSCLFIAFIVFVWEMNVRNFSSSILLWSTNTFFKPHNLYMKTVLWKVKYWKLMQSKNLVPIIQYSLYSSKWFPLCLYKFIYISFHFQSSVSCFIQIYIYFISSPRICIQRSIKQFPGNHLFSNMTWRAFNNTACSLPVLCHCIPTPFTGLLHIDW